MSPSELTDRGPWMVDLDPEVDRQKREHQERRLETLRVPQLRTMGLAAITVLVWLHVVLVPGSGGNADALLFSIAAAAYICVSWTALKLLHRPGANSKLGLFFLVTDVLMFAFAIWCTGVERSWLFALLTVRVADIARPSVSRAMGFAFFGVAVYAALLASAFGMGRPIDLVPEAVKLVTLLVIGLQIAASARSTEQERARATAAAGQLRDLDDELKRSAEALANSNAQAQAASTARSEFLASMSHEIRTPMNGILGTVELALASEPGDEQTQLLRTAHSSTHSLLRVINDILDFSKAGTGELQIASEPFDPRGLVDRTVAGLSTLAEEKLIEIRAHVADDVPERLLGDAEHLGRVLVNLVDNAIKFTELGTVEVDVAVENRATNSLQLHVTVSDTGIGISAAKQRQIFEAFTQADNTSRRAHGGTGLGLSICSQLVELMGGRIWVESEEEQGSHFHFTLCCGLPSEANAASTAAQASSTRKPRPARKPRRASSDDEVLTLSLPDEPPRAQDAPSVDDSNDSNETPAPSADEGSAPNSLNRRTERPLRLLLVEDNRVNQLVAARFLSTWGHAVEVADNGRLGLEALDRAPFDAVLMDIHMPVMDGFEATRKLRLNEQRRGGHLPIIALTAHAMAGDRERCLAAGMDDYVSKPIQPDVLFEAIERVQLDEAFGRIS